MIKFRVGIFLLVRVMGDAAAGKKLFVKVCATCHNVDKGGKHKIGPNLFGIMGHTCGSEYL